MTKMEVSNQDESVSWAPLAGVRVVELSRIIAGPFAAQTLADMGAEVIKVETLPRGEEGRTYGTASIDGEPISSLFVALNGGKRSIGIDFKHPDGYSLLRSLVETADVLIHNYRPGVVERLKLDFETVSVWKPDLVYCSISGFGETGPLAQRAANDIAAQAQGGLMSFTGNEGAPPARCPISIADHVTGLNGAIGILAALNERHRTGRGVKIEVALLQTMLTLTAYQLTDCMVTGFVPVPEGSGSRLGQPNQAFPTEDGWVVISATSDAMWERCCRALEAEEWIADPRFSTQAAI